MQRQWLFPKNVILHIINRETQTLSWSKRLRWELFLRAASLCAAETAGTSGLVFLVKVTVPCSRIKNNAHCGYLTLEIHLAKRPLKLYNIYSGPGKPAYMEVQPPPPHATSPSLPGRDSAHRDGRVLKAAHGGRGLVRSAPRLAWLELRRRFDLNIFLNKEMETSRLLLHESRKRNVLRKSEIEKNPENRTKDNVTHR